MIRFSLAGPFSVESIEQCGSWWLVVVVVPLLMVTSRDYREAETAAVEKLSVHVPARLFRGYVSNWNSSDSMLGKCRELSTMPILD